MTRGALLLVAAAIACHGDVRDPGLVARGVVRRTREAAAHAKPAEGVSGVTVLPQSGHAGKIEAAALSADGTLLATGGDDGAALVWDLRSGKLLRRFSEPGEVDALAFAGDGAGLWVGSHQAIVEHRFDSDRLAWREPLPGMGGQPRMIATTPDDAHAIFAIAEGAMVIDKAAGTAVALSVEHGPIAMDRMSAVQVFAVALDPTGAHALTATEHAVVAWDVATRMPTRLDCVGSDGSLFRAVGFWRDRAYAVRASGGVLVWDAQTHRCIDGVDGDGTWSYPGIVDPSTGELHGFIDNDVSEHVVARRTWSVTLGADELRARLGERTVVPEHDTEIAIASGAPRAAVIDGGIAHVVDLDGGGTLLDLAVARQVTANIPRAVALAPDGATAVVAYDDRVVHLDLATMQRTELARVPHATALALCDDARHVAIATAGGALTVIDDLEHPKARALPDLGASRVASIAIAFDPRCADVIAATGSIGAALAVHEIGIDGTKRATARLPAHVFQGGSSEAYGQRYGAQSWIAVQIGAASWQIAQQGDSVGVVTGDLTAPGASATSADGAWRLERVSDSEMQLYDASGTAVTYGLTALAMVRSVQIAADARTITVGQLGGWIDRWDLAANAPVGSMNAPASLLAMSRDGALAIADGDAGLVAAPVADLSHPRTALRGHRSRVVAASIAARAPRALTAAEDGTLRLWNTDSGDSLALATVGDDWIQYTNEGYFNASPDGAELVSVVAGDRAYNIDQLAAQYDRPDVLLERFGLATAPIRDALSARVASAMTRAGVATAAAAPDIPRVQIASTVRAGDALDLAVDARATRSPLVGLRVDVNGVPVLSRALAGDRASEKVRVPLAVGDNRVEVSAIDAAGLESYRALVAAHRDGDVRRDLYFVGFGVSAYARDELRLGYAAKDANDLAAQMLHYRGRGYHDVHVTTFEDAGVDRAALAEATRFLAAARLEDDVIIFVAGHGVLDEQTGVYYYLPYRANPDDLAHTAITFAELEQLSAGIASRRRLVLMDTCDSGELDPTDLALATSTAKQAGLVARVEHRATAPAAVAATRLPSAYRESMLFRDVFRRSGAIVLSSSRGGELSYEDPRLGNGLFTHAVLRALTTSEADRDGDGMVSLAELRRYLTEHVGKLSGDRQHPTIDRDNRFLRLAFPIAP